jgi:hypothetical protein
MTPEKLEKIAANSAEMLKELICGSSDEIRATILHVLEEAQIKSEETDTEPKAKITLIHRLEIDLTKLTQKDTLSWHTAHKVETTQLLPEDLNAEEEEERKTQETLAPEDD